MHDDELRRRADLHGVSPGYHDATGQWRDSPVETLRAILAAMGVEAADEPPPAPAALVVRPGAPQRLPDGFAGATVALEGGGEAAAPELLPGGLPEGYHALVAGDRRLPLVVVPDRAYLPSRLADGGRMWGVAVQLYAARSARSWGIGDLGDLPALAAALGDPDFLLLNPLHAGGPGPHQQPSPYYAASRRFRSPLALALESAPEAAALDADEAARLAALAAAGRALAARPLIDRDAIWALKREALALLVGALARTPARATALAAYRAADPELDRFATWCALAERHPGDWRAWPAELRDPAGGAVRDAAAGLRDAVDLFAYAQLLADEQLAAVPPLGLGLITDLAVGAARDGYEAWAHQGVVADGMKVGAPPDLLGPFGQDWGLPPLLPRPLAAAGFEPLAGIVRSAMQHAGGLRIDHVMGLSRLFWIPDGRTPADGAYVRYDVDALLGIVALESQRARCLVVGEDLGVVEPSLRDALGARDILSYRLAWFEERPAHDFPRLAMAAVTTHDLPTVAGFMSGSDLEHLHAIGVLDDETHARFAEREAGERHRLRERLAREGLDGAWSDDPRDVARALHAFVARTPSMLACVSLDDVVGATQRPNVPGTIDQHPNWRLPLPVTVEEIAGDPGAAAALAPLRERA